MENEQTKQEHVGKQIEQVANEYGCIALMNDDNKKMLEKVKDQKTNQDVVKALLSDPNSGRSISYAESRMRFG